MHWLRIGQANASHVGAESGRARALDHLTLERVTGGVTTQKVSTAAIRLKADGAAPILRGGEGTCDDGG